jgi:DNA-binding PucR family transcriptional regulator
VTSLRDNEVWRSHVSPFAGELIPRTAEIARAFTAAIHQRVPEIAANPALAGLTLASAEANIGLVLTMIRDGDPVESVTPPAVAVAQAREYAAIGAEVTSLHRTYRVGHQLFWSLFVAPLRERIADPAELAEATVLATEYAFHYIDAISTSTVEIFTAERELWLRSSAALRADTVRGILSGTASDARAASHRLGYDLDRPHVAFLVWADPTEQDVLGLLEDRGARLAAALGARSSLLVPLGRLTIAGWISSRTTPAEPPALDVGHPEVSVRAAVGSAQSGIDGFRVSHLQAAQARRIVELTRPPAGHIELYERVALVALATQDPLLARSFVADELGTLADGSSSSERIAETLAAYLAEGSSPARAAMRLGVHENTVANRIAKAEMLLGYPVERRRVELALALRMRGAAQHLS